MNLMRSVSLAALMAVLAGPVLAADYRAAPAAPPVAAELRTEFGSGWYLRGDIGYAFDSKPDMSFMGGDFGSGSGQLSGDLTLGLGFGYKEAWFRTDITLDGRLSSAFSGRTSGIVTPDCGFAPDGTEILACHVSHRASLQSINALWNVYADLGTWYGFTPYIGAGIGMSHLLFGPMRSQFNSEDPVMPPGTPPYSEVAQREHGRVNLAWALMAGVSYAFGQNLSMDVGYRYLNMGMAATRRDGVGRSQVDNIDQHEVRVGFRWMID